MDMKLLLALGMMCSLEFKDAPVSYNHYKLNINNNTQQVHSLLVDINNPNISLNNRLSYDKIYGFEKPTAIDSRFNPIASVNGAFYNNFGLHAGGLIMNSNIITLPVPTTPMVLINRERQPVFTDLEITAKLVMPNESISIKGKNRYMYNNELLLYTPIYGLNTRIHVKSINYVLVENKVADIIISSEPIPIPRNGELIVDVGATNKLPLKIGDEVLIDYEYKPEQGSVIQGFQTGGWLLKDSKNIAKKYEPFMGITTNREPRTLIGQTNDNKLLFNVVDGRQKNSKGLTGYEAAELMKYMNCKNAAYLDGGASSTMLINGKIVNIPSNKGQERDLAHILSIEKVAGNK